MIRLQESVRNKNARITQLKGNLLKLKIESQVKDTLLTEALVQNEKKLYKEQRLFDKLRESVEEEVSVGVQETEALNHLDSKIANYRNLIKRTRSERSNTPIPSIEPEVTEEELIGRYDSMQCIIQ